MAVKILNKAEVDAHQYLQLLLKEASILSNLKHPNIIKLLGIVLDPIKLVSTIIYMYDYDIRNHRSWSLPFWGICCPI